MASGSAYLNARARALIGQLLPAGELARLVELDTADEVARDLEARRWFRHGGNEGLALIQRLGAELDGDCRDTIVVIGQPGRTVVRALYSRREAEFIKAILGCAHRGIPPSVRPSFTGAAHLFDRTAEAPLFDAATLDEAISRVPLPYRPILENSLHGVEEAGSLFPLEVALDLAVLHRMWLAARGLSGSERSRVGLILGTWFDVFNITAACRLRLIMRVRSEEALGYLLHHGQHLGLMQRRALVAASSMNELLAALRGLPYAAVLADAKACDDIERALVGYFRTVLTGVLSGNPFHLGVTIAYLFLKELEIGSLSRIIEAKRYRLEASEVSKLLV